MKIDGVKIPKSWRFPEGVGGKGAQVNVGMIDTIAYSVAKSDYKAWEKDIIKPPIYLVEDAKSGGNHAYWLLEAPMVERDREMFLAVLAELDRVMPNSTRLSPRTIR